MIVITNFNSKIISNKLGCDGLSFETGLIPQKIDDKECIVLLYNPIKSISTYDIIQQYLGINKHCTFYIFDFFSHISKFTSESLLNAVVINGKELLFKYGYDNCIDLRYWYNYEYPFTKQFTDVLIQEYHNTKKALDGDGIKAIILDADNTLWNGILLEGTADFSNMFKDFQSKLLDLRECGVFLALCSKNNSNDLFEFMEKNTILKQEHFSSHRVNFNSKADNVVEILNELNINPKHTLFIDDNQYERDIVKQSIPDIHVDYDELIVKTLDNPLLKKIAITDEDYKRVDSFEKIKKAKTIKHSLKLTTIPDVCRIAQMSGKTNQFNMNKTVLNAQEVLELIKNKSIIACILMINNISYGIIGYATYENDTITNMVVSCRAFNMNVENNMLDYLKEKGCTKGLIKLTEKNKKFSSFYEDNQIEEIYI